jgi:hypothetical protein
MPYHIENTCYAQGYIKGYVAHKAKYLVVSQKNAFPKVAEILG